MQKGGQAGACLNLFLSLGLAYITAKSEKNILAGEAVAAAMFLGMK